MTPELRRTQIEDLARAKTKVQVEELASLLKTSRETIRRDLALLSEQGRVRKIHGGAIYTQTAQENPPALRSGLACAEKQMIGHAAAGLFRDGDSLLIDSGSTTAAFAQELAIMGSFSVITNSVLVAQAFSTPSSKTEAFLLGGKYFGEGRESLGSLTLEQIERVSADHVVLTIGAIDEAGQFMDFNADEGYVARAMIKRSARVTVLADWSKFGRRAMFQVCDATEVDCLVTDRPPPPAIASALNAARVEIVIAARQQGDQDANKRIVA
ncbi:MAG: DeoR/GlpR family DNA-binding transcription regulator [Verrucomicrobia bacterium]|nr:DeoR/GlpR family DNA-binding transcription regulator [Verrucomicrobiota bacterium]